MWRFKVVFSWLMAALLINFSGLAANAEPGKCYILVENAGSFSPDIIVSSSVSIVSRYFKKVEMPPPSGLRFDDCTYTVNLSEGANGYFISFSGENLNSIGNSTKTGMDGVTQALLRAVYRTSDSETVREQVCRDYAELLENDCKLVEAVIFLFNESGVMIPQGSIVRENDQFNVMIQPINTLYAYIIALDSSGNLFKIFPNSDVTSQQNPLQAGSQYYFPPLQSEVIFAFDQVPGEEKLYFLLSATPVEEIESFFQNLEGIRNETDRKQAVDTFEKQFTTRGFSLKKKNTDVTLQQTDGASHLIQQKVMAELLTGSGVLVKTVTLTHVR